MNLDLSSGLIVDGKIFHDEGCRDFRNKDTFEILDEGHTPILLRVAELVWVSLE